MSYLTRMPDTSTQHLRVNTKFEIQLKFYTENKYLQTVKPKYVIANTLRHSKHRELIM